MNVIKLNKKILMVSYYFPPTIGGGIFRVMRFIKYLPKKGWIPVVLTAQGSYVIGENRQVGEKILNEVPGEIKIIRTKSLELLSAGRRQLREIQSDQDRVKKTILLKIYETILLFLKKLFSKMLLSLLIPDEVIGWVLFAVIRGKKIIKRDNIDVIYTTSPPASVHLVGLFLKKITGKFWIADFRDPWTQKVDFMKYLFVRRKIENFLEKIVIRNADKVITTTSAITAHFKNKYPCFSTKIITITNGYDPNDFINISDAVLTNKFTITHTGYVCGYRNALPFLQAIFNLTKNGLISRADIEVRFIGYADKKTENFINDNGLHDVVKIINYLPHSEVIKHQKESSVLLLITDHRGVIQIPGKLFEYLFSGRPIIALVPEGVCTEIIVKTMTGKTVPLDDVEKMMETIKQMYRDFKRDKLKIMPDYKEIEKYSAGNLTERLIQCINLD